MERLEEVEEPHCIVVQGCTKDLNQSELIEGN